MFAARAAAVMTDHQAAREAVRIACPVCGATVTQPPTRGRYRVACPGACVVEWKKRVLYLKTGTNRARLAEYREQRAALDRQLSAARAAAECARIACRIQRADEYANRLRATLTTTERARP